MSANENLLESLTPEQLAVAARFQNIPAEILLQLSFAVVSKSVDVFTLTLAGMTTGKDEAREYFRTYREFLNLPEVAASLQS